MEERKAQRQISVFRYVIKYCLEINNHVGLSIINMRIRKTSQKTKILELLIICSYSERLELKYKQTHISINHIFYVNKLGATNYEGQEREMRGQIWPEEMLCYLAYLIQLF